MIRQRYSSSSNGGWWFPDDTETCLVFLRMTFQTGDKAHRVHCTTLLVLSHILSRTLHVQICAVFLTILSQAKLFRIYPYRPVYYRHWCFRRMFEVLHQIWQRNSYVKLLKTLLDIIFHNKYALNLISPRKGAQELHAGPNYLISLLSSPHSVVSITSTT